MPNPSKKRKKPSTGRRSRSGKRADAALGKAKRLATRFHGHWRGHVYELTPKERKLSRYVVAAGTLEDYTYAPKKGSKRAFARWKHESLDRGLGKPKGRKKPLLAVDPATKKPVIVARGAAVEFSGRRGFVG